MRSATYILLLGLVAFGTACNSGPDPVKEALEQELSTCRQELANVTVRAENLAAILKGAQEPPPPPPPPPPPKMPEWQVVRYAPNGTVVKIMPAFSWNVSGACVYFMQTEHQKASSVVCSGQFDVVNYEPK